MRLRILSDLHEEFAPKLGSLALEACDADITILAGDIANGLDAVEVAKRGCFANTQVILVPGNHEYYGTSLSAGLNVMRAAVSGVTSLHLLHRQALEIGPVRFLGATLWTDYALHGVDQRDEAMRLAAPIMADYRLIHKDDGTKLTAQDTVTLHEQELAWLSSELAKPWAGKTVLISHHAPHPNSVAKRFQGNPINGGFVSDLTRMMPGVDLWIHGHTHDGFDYRVSHAQGSTRVVANPAGYRKRAPLGDGMAGGFSFENPTFNPNLVVEL